MPLAIGGWANSSSGREAKRRRPVDGTIPGDAAPETFNPEPAWPIAEAVDEALENRFQFLSAAQLNSDEHTTRYLIPGILAAAQPGGIYGPFKSLKTSLAADLAISLASGTPFLGRFPVTEPGRVLFLAGENGLPALQSLRGGSVPSGDCRWPRSITSSSPAICRGSIGPST